MKYTRTYLLALIQIALIMLGIPLVGCSPVVTTSSSLTPGSLCGNGFCDTGETSISCPLDCPVAGFSGQIQTTTINSVGIGDIAVMVAAPKAARFPEGAGVIVVVPPIFNTVDSFMTEPDLPSLGLIQVSFMWPGQTDKITGSKSSGAFDSGGEQSIQVLRDVIRFASGLIPDNKNRYLPALVQVTPLTGEVGVYAFSDAGLAVVNVFKLYGDLLPGVQFYVGRENPTVDTLSCLEAGYLDDSGQPVYNPFYNFPASYSSSAITLTYTNVRWDATYTDAHTGAVGRAYLDLDSSGTVSANDFIMSWRVPIIFGKRTYSVALTQALLDNGALTVSTWPADLATPEEAARDWPFRQSTGRYVDLRTMMPDLKVMLVFAQVDHAQAVQDKPHIHQAYQGFRFEAGLWVRLNPDRAYVQSLLPAAGEDFPDNPANTQPGDWMQIGAYAYPGQGTAGRLVPLAAVAEMADRAHFGRWDENLGQVLYIYFPPTSQP
ncbi:MAG TPA: hypothetical protein VF359_01050 [Anaerolineales bacterium]